VEKRSAGLNMVGEGINCKSVGIWKEVVVACLTKPHWHELHSNPFFVPSHRSTTSTCGRDRFHCS